MTFKFITAILLCAVLIGCHPIHGGETGIDLSESHTWNALGPGFDSPHLHSVVGGDAVPLTTASPSATTLTTTTTTTTPPVTTTTQSMLHTHYDYYEHSPRVTELQLELGMKVVDGVYGPNTRRSHIDAMGGSMSVLLRNYPEMLNGDEPCSHGCIPGDEHYELPTLGALINEYFLPEDRALAQRIAFCESSGRSWDVGSDVVSDALAVGWFQHLAKYWEERSEKAGWDEYHPFHGEANVAVAAWLFYNSGGHHWNPSKGCWG